MDQQLIFILCFFFFLFKVSVADTTTTTTLNVQTRDNPFTAKASLVRYWNKHILNHHPRPIFLISKASPLNAIDMARFSKMATEKSLSSHIESFCSSANLFCSFDLVAPPTPKDANFAHYSNKNFANYGSDRLGGVDSFANYSDDLNQVSDSFKKYSRASTGHHETFASYGRNGNVANGSFTNYGEDATGGSGEFTSYDALVNVPNLRFTNYDSDGNNHKLTFKAYTEETNSGTQTFTTYGKNGNGVPSEFIKYGENSNIIASSFTTYGELGNAANDSFTGYGETGNNPHNNFKSYGNEGNAGTDSFINYRNGANVGDDTFQSYARNSNSGKVSFSNYGKTFNPSNDSFKEYGKGSVGKPAIEFKSYTINRSFKDYVKGGVTFSQYSNETFSSSSSSGNSVKRWVEEGKFFRESMIKEGNVMVMPDIKDKMPQRSFLPRKILSNLPFTATGLSEIFHAQEGSATDRVIRNALAECEQAPSQGETKRCVGSIEDMIDFSSSVLGQNVVVRSTENTNGSKTKVMIGSVKGINGGEMTESVSCHQSLFPYLLYYCHSVPKVRVYEADILDEESKAKINRGVAICHIDTSAWSPGHGAFVALGSKPGQIEVCHWIFENDMTWAVADN